MLSIENSTHRFIRRLSDIDPATLYGIAAKIISGLNWSVAAIAASITLSKVAQGFFFTFLSLSTIQMLFDLGIGMGIIQFAAHEWALLPDGKPERHTSDAASRLASILRFSIRWYFIGAAVLLVALGIAGLMFFGSASISTWLGPWLFLSAMVACDFAVSAFWYVLEGCNQIRRVYRYRAIKALLLGAGVWVSLMAGYGLYALGIGYFLTLPVSIGLLSGPNWRLISWLRGLPEGSAVNWRREILPLQWRLAVSFISGYFAQWGITPITFKLFGPVVAGQFGMVWSIINALSAVANVIVMVRAPQYGMLVAARKFHELDRLALRTSLISVGMALVGCGTLAEIIYLLNVAGSPLAERLLPPAPSFVLLAATVVAQIVSPIAVYLRSHKKEPLLWLAIVFAGSLVVLASAVGPRYGPLGIALVYFFLMACVLLPGAVFVFIRCRKEWHSIADD